jgi:hypothetical protein
MSVQLVRTIFILMLLVLVGVLPSNALASPLADAPSNDNFLNAQVLDGPMGNVSASNVGATREDWEPSHASGTGSASIWYIWTALSDGSMTFDTLGSDFDTLLAVYTWPNSSGPLNEVGSNDDASSNVTTSSVTFNALTGQLYYIAVDGYNGQSGNVVLNWASANPVVFQPTESPTPDTALTPSQSTVCPPPQIASFTTNRPEIKRGDTTTLNWGAVTNATSAVIDNGIGGVPTPGSRQIRPDKNTTYTLTANGCGGTKTAQTTIGVFAIGELYQGIPEGQRSFQSKLQFNWSNRSGYDGDTYLSAIEIEIERNGSYQPFETTVNFELQGNGYENKKPFPQGKYKIRFRWWMTDRVTHQRVSFKSAWSVICFNYNDNETCR